MKKLILLAIIVIAFSLFARWEGFIEEEQTTDSTYVAVHDVVVQEYTQFTTKLVNTGSNQMSVQVYVYPLYESPIDEENATLLEVEGSTTTTLSAGDDIQVNSWSYSWGRIIIKAKATSAGSNTTFKVSTMAKG